MASRFLAPSIRTVLPPGFLASRRSFQSSMVRLDQPVHTTVVRRPVGAFRGGYVCFLYPILFPNRNKNSFASQMPCKVLCAIMVSVVVLALTHCRCRLFGFLFGSTLAGAGTYYYILEEYRTSNELLTEDIYVRLCI